MGSTGPAVKDYSLQAETELRLEVDYKTTVEVTLLQGTAEIFGCELAIKQELTFKGTKLAIFTWKGAVLQVKGEVEHVYVADETPMKAYLNTHSILEKRRLDAREAGASGQARPDKPPPVTMVVGPTDSGKSSLVKLLTNYAVREGWKPLLVDLDLGQGMFTAPGTLSATLVERPVEPVEGVPLDAPLIYYYGAATPQENPEHFTFLQKQLAKTLKERTADAEAKAAGIFINTMGWVEGLGYKLLLEAVQAFGANVVLVVGQDRLHSELEKDLARTVPEVDVVKLSKSGGVVTRSREFRKATREKRVQEYFYGVEDDLRVTTRTATFAELSLFRIGGAFRAPSSTLPMGMESQADPMRVMPVQWTRDIVHSVLAVSHATNADDLLTANIAGFVWVTDVDVARGTLTYHAPCAGPLPSANLIYGDLKFYE